MNNKFRVIHRYLGFFLSGIMLVYALSGITLVFRNTDYLKKEVLVEKVIAKELSDDELGRQVKIKGLKTNEEQGAWRKFKQGQYNAQTGEVSYVKMELPYILDKMTHMHKATTSSPLFFLNIFFGLSLLFFVISAFWMFLPSNSVFKKGMYFALGGIILTLIMLFV